MIATTSSSAEMRLEPVAQSGFRSRTHCMGTNSDDSQNSPISCSVFTRLPEEIDTALGQRRARRKVTERLPLTWRLGETCKE
jgi:hypothetical protein